MFRPGKGLDFVNKSLWLGQPKIPLATLLRCGEMMNEK
jgi:hypothetical protein